MNMQNIIEINNLDKSFQDVHAVNDLSLRVKEGELFAFLGVNGAGKSTTISIMCGMLAKDGGKVFIDGKDVDKDMREITKELGVVFQNTVLDAKLSVKDNLTSRAALYGITGKEAKQRIAHLAELLEFKDILNRTFGKLSGGQKRRVDVARALLNNPKILILDEPMNGLDNAGVQDIRALLLELKAQGKTILLASHNHEDIAALCDTVHEMDGGVLE